MAELDKYRLKQILKTLVIEECDKQDELSANDISDTESLLGDEATLEMDSLDTLQVSMAIKKKFGVRIEGVKQARIAYKSIDALADYIISHH